VFLLLKQEYQTEKSTINTKQSKQKKINCWVMHPVARVSTNTLIKTTVRNKCISCSILPEDGHRSGPKHVVVVHNKIEHEKHLLRTVVLIKILVKKKLGFLHQEQNGQGTHQETRL
jgi:hypothetical protein